MTQTPLPLKTQAMHDLMFMNIARLLPKPLRIIFAVLAAFAAVSAARATDANPPGTLTYQGYLTDGNGVALATNAPKNYNVVFRIYSLQSGGSTIWSEQQTITVDKGYFSVLLGEGSAVGPTGATEPRPDLASLFLASDASDRYIEVTVLGVGSPTASFTILPRLRLQTAPYAFLSRYSVTAGGMVNSTNGPMLTLFGNVIYLANPLNVTGKITSVSGGADLGGDVTVAGNITVASNIVSTTGNLSAKNITASGPISTTGNISTSAGTFSGYGTIPTNGIIMWYGTCDNVPVGWALCDGTQGTPNLSDKFIIAASRTKTPVNVPGGNANGMVTLSVANLPPHTHGMTGQWQDYTSGAWGLDAGHLLVGNGTVQTQSTGSGTAFNIMPPYYALAYIMRIR